MDHTGKTSVLKRNATKERKRDSAQNARKVLY